MRSIIKPLQIIYVLYAFALFVVLMIPVFIWSLFCLLFGRIRGGNMIYYACIAWADTWCFFTGIYHKNIFKEKLAPGRSYIFVSNHISYMDSAIVPKTLRHPVRPLGKIEMSKIPIFGLIYKNVIVAVDRSSAEHRAESVRTMKSVLSKGISILVFPEGTFNTTNDPLKPFYDGAFRIAIETGTPIRPLLLLDTYDRMHYHSIFSLNPGKSRTVFLPEVPVEGLIADDVGPLKLKVFRLMEEELLRNNATWIKNTAIH
jgi:1-acyl-sn-glycerol-3-phosphate acyltransferase